MWRCYRLWRKIFYTSLPLCAGFINGVCNFDLSHVTLHRLFFTSTTTAGESKRASVSAYTFVLLLKQNKKCVIFLTDTLNTAINVTFVIINSAMGQWWMDSARTLFTIQPVVKPRVCLCSVPDCVRSEALALTPSLLELFTVAVAT